MFSGGTRETKWVPSGPSENSYVTCDLKKEGGQCNEWTRKNYKWPLSSAWGKNYGHVLDHRWNG